MVLGGGGGMENVFPSDDGVENEGTGGFGITFGGGNIMVVEGTSMTFLAT